MTATAPRLGLLGDGAGTAPSDAQTITVFASVVFAYASALLEYDTAKASLYLSFFQDFWTNTGWQVKRFATSHGVATAALAAFPDDLPVSGGWDSHTRDIAGLVLLLYLGDSVRPALPPPASSSSVALWFVNNISDRAAPTSSVWTVWNGTKHTPAAQLQSGNIISNVALAFWNGGAPTSPAPATNPAPPPAAGGPQPQATPLPTVRQGAQVMVSGRKLPQWFWFAGGAILLGAVVGGGYYLYKKRPDLFRSRAKKRR